MSSQNTYFVNVDGLYRDNGLWPNPTDFGINFSTFSGTGTYVQGNPLNVDSFFQQASIDPDYVDNNLQFVNASINQQERTSSSYIVSGLYDITKDFSINYLESNLYFKPGVEFTGPSPTGVYRYVTMSIPYVASFTVDLNAVVPYALSWIFYIKPSIVPEIWINLSTKATFQLSQNNNIYFLFDFNMRQFDFVLQKNNQTTLLTSVTNPTIDPKLSNYVGGNYGSICLCLTYIDKSGDVGIVNNHAYGYHLFYGDGDVLGSATNGSFSLTSDFADNALLSLTFNPSHQKLTNIMQTGFDYSKVGQSWGNAYVYQQEEEFYFMNSTGPVYPQYSSKAFAASVIAFYTGPFLCQFIQEKSDTPYMDFITVNPYPLNTAQTWVASSLLFTGASNEVFWWISSLDANLNLVNPTGSDIFTLNKTTYAMTPVTRISSTGCASLAFAKTGANTYLFSQNITNWMDVYSYNTSTFVATKITGIQIPTFYFFIRQVFTIVIGTNIFVYSLPSWPGFAPSSYNVLGSQPAFVLLFDTITNTLSIVSTFSYYNSTSFQLESLSIRPTKTYLVSGSIGQNKILFYDITNPANVQISSEILCNNIVNHTTWSYTEGGKTRYYLLGNISGTPFCKYYDITEIDNIYELKNSNFYVGENHFELSTFSSYLGNGRVLSIIDLSYFDPNPNFVQSWNIALLPTKPITLKSVQYNQNLQLTSTLPIIASCCVTFNFNNNAYCVFASNLALQIYNITSIRSNLLVATIPLGLPTTLFDIQFIDFGGNLYFLCCGLGYVFSFVLLPTLISIVPTGLFTAIPDAYSEGRFFIQNGSLFAVVVSFTSRLYRFAFVPSLTLTNFVNVLPPFLPAIGAVYFDIVTSTFCLYLTTTNLTSFADYNFFYNVSSGITLVNSFVRNPGLIPRSASQVLTDPRTGKLYSAGYVNIAVGTSLLESYSARNVTRNFQTVDLPTHINGKTQLYYTDRPYLVTNVYGGTGSNGDYINVYDLTDLEYPIMVFKNDINIVGTGASPLSPNFIVDMKTSIIQDRVTLVCLNSNNTFYLYDISNPEFAGSTQTLQTVTNTQTFSFCPSFGFVYKLNSEGTTQFALSARSEFTSTGVDGCQINLSNVKIASNNISLYTCGGFNEKIQLYNPGASSPVNQIVNLGGSYDGFVAKANIVTGQWEWIVPLESFGNDFVQKLQYIASLDSVSFAGYTTAGNLVLLQQQNAGSLVTPVTPQYNVVGSSNTTNSFVFLLDNKGNYKWGTSIYTNDSLREVNLIDIGVEGSQLVVTGLSNANTIQCIDSTGKNVQNLYTKVLDNAQKSIINYYFNTSGVYQKSQSILLPYATVGSPTDIKLNSGLNNITLTVSIDYKSLLNTVYYNKDGTIAHTDTGETNSLVSYVVDYLYDSRYTDPNNKAKYSIVRLAEPPNYPFTGGFMTNYSLYVLGTPDDPVLNQNFSIRNNDENPTGVYDIILNSTVDTSKIDRQFFTVNGITGSNEYYNVNVSTSPLTSIFEYNISAQPTLNNTITSIGLNNLNTSFKYYLTFPKGGEIVSIPVLSVTQDNNGDYVFQLSDVNDLREYPAGPFYGPYLYLTSFNRNVFYNLQFFPANITTPVYYTISLRSLVLPNRPLRQPDTFIKNLTSMPYIYLAIYCVDANDKADSEIVNIVYDNNPNRENVAIFQLNTIAAGDASNFVTYSTTMTPRIKFLPKFNTLRVQLFDRNGDVLLFDNTPYKASDADYLGGVVPPQLMNISVQFLLTKIA
jgi:hypothetical protein